MTNLTDVVFKGNPFTLQNGDVKTAVDRDRSEVCQEIKKRIPSVIMIDGELAI